MEHFFNGPDLSLIQPLGQCIIDKEQDWLSHWDWFIPPDREFAFRQVRENHWRRHLRKPGTNHTFYTEFMDLTDRPTQLLLRASVRCVNNSWVLLNTSINSSYSIRDSQPHVDHIGCIPYIRPQEDWFLQQLSSSDTTNDLWTCILQP